MAEDNVNLIVEDNINLMSNVNTKNSREEEMNIIINNNDEELPLDQAINNAYKNNKFI